MTLKFPYSKIASLVQTAKNYFFYSFAFLLLLILNGDCCNAQQSVGYQWAKTPYATNMSSTSMVTDASGNVYIAGFYQGSLSFGSITLTASAGAQNTFFVKYDSNGNVVWAKAIRSVTNYSNSGKDIALDGNGNVYLIGTFYGTVDFDPTDNGIVNLSSLGSYEDIYLAKYDSNGNYIWAKAIGGTDPDVGNSLALDSIGNIYVAGSFSLTADFDPGVGTANLTSSGSFNAFYAKYTTNGDYIWAKKLNATYCTAICLDNSANIYLEGSYSNTVDFDPAVGTANLISAGGFDIFFAKYDNSGGYFWAKSIGGTSSDYAYAMTLDGNGNIIITGGSSVTIDFDPGSGIVNIANGCAGFFLAKYDNNGNYLFVKNVGGTDLSVDAGGNIYLTGSFINTCDFDPSAGIANLTATSNTNSAFFSKYDSNGMYQWARNVNGASGGSCIAVDGNGNFYVAGSYMGIVDFNPGPGTTNLANGSLFVTKYFDCSTYSVPLTSTIIITPPACFGGSNGFATVSVNGGSYPYSYSWNTSPQQNTVTVNNLSAGNYIITLTDSLNCYIMDTATVQEPTEIAVSVSASDVSCNGGSDGALAGVASGGTAPYIYSWNTLPVQVGSSATNLSVGDYTLIVTDSHNCIKYEYASIQEPSSISFINLGSVATNCSGPCTGELNVHTLGGTPPYSFLWDSGAENQISEAAYNLCEGSYLLTVTDAEGCIATYSDSIIVKTSSFDSQVFLTNLAAVDELSVSPSFSSYYTYNLPSSITPPPSNPRNFVDPGKRARFKVECTNQKGNGQSIVSGICKVRTNNPYIIVTDSSSALNNIGWGNIAWSADEFEIDIAGNTPVGTNAYIDFIVQESGQDYTTTCISIPISPLVYSPTTSLTIDDDNNPDSQGNDNDICEPGEIIEFYPWLDNISTLDAEYVRGRFENLDNHNFITIWNGVPGVGTTVYDATWWNYSFAQPQTINPYSISTTPEYDFVFSYANTSLVDEFKLYLVVAGGFKLFSGEALSLVQWSLPYTFNSTGTSSTNGQVEAKNHLNIYPNPTSSFITIENESDKLVSEYIVFNSIGKVVLSGKLSRKTTIDLNELPTGIYLIKVGEQEKQSFKIIKK